MTISITKPTIGQGPGWGALINTALDAIVTEVNAFEVADTLTPTAVKTANYTAAAGDFVPVDTTSNVVTVTLPTAPANKTQVAVKHVIQGGTNAVTIAAAGADVFNKTGGATSFTLPMLAQGTILQYKATGAIWYILSDDLALTQLDARYSATYVMKANVSLNVKDYGAVGDGTADDTTAVGNAFTAFMAVLNGGQPCDLLFPPGAYKVTHGYTLTPTANVVGGTIRGPGAKIAQVSGSPDNYILTLKTQGASHNWHRPTVEGLHFDNGGLCLQAGGSSEFLFNFTIDKVYVTNGLACPLLLSSVFEGTVLNSFFELKSSITPTDDTQCAVRIDNGGGSQPSSIGLMNVSTRGGFRGIRGMNSADVRIYNATVLAAQQEGIYLQGGRQTIVGVHVEDCWLQTSSSNGAAVRVDGGGFISGVLCNATTGASQAPYSGSTTCRFGVQVYVFNTDTTGTTIAGHVTISDVVLETNVASPFEVYVIGGQAGSTCYLAGGVPTHALNSDTIRVVDAAAGVLDTVAASVTAGAALVVNRHNPVNATSAPITMTLPTGQAIGATVSVEKTDSSANAVTVSGSIRGVGSSTITLALQNETLRLMADSNGSWWPIGSHKTLASLDAHNDGRYVAISGEPLAAPLIATYYYAPLGATNSVGLQTQAFCAGGVLVVGRTCTLTEIGIQCTTIGSSGSVTRLGIYKIRNDGSYIADLLVDAGTVDTTGTGYLSKTISQPVSAGDKLILTATQQGAPATTATLRQIASGANPYVGHTDGATAVSTVIVGSGVSGVTGALPSTHALTAAGTVPRVVVKAAT